MQHPHKVTLHVATGAAGQSIVVCKPSKLSDNRIKIGGIIRFEAADVANHVEIGLSGDATFTPGPTGAFFEEFTAATPGKFDFGANLTLPDGMVIGWAAGEGGEGEVHI
jgi:hypothetical protein